MDFPLIKKNNLIRSFIDMRCCYSIPSGLSFTPSNNRRLAPTAIIVQSAHGLEEPEHHPEKGETILAVPKTGTEKVYYENRNPKRV